MINPNWLTTETDQQLALAMFKRIRQAFDSDAMKPVLIGSEYYPGREVESDEEILEYVRNNISPIWHPACTCKMGTSDDPMAVVDNHARVFGVDGLRLVDASAFPLLPPGHPQATVCKSTALSMFPYACLWSKKLFHAQTLTVFLQICWRRKSRMLFETAHDQSTTLRNADFPTSVRPNSRFKFLSEHNVSTYYIVAPL